MKLKNSWKLFFSIHLYIGLKQLSKAIWLEVKYRRHIHVYNVLLGIPVGKLFRIFKLKLSYKLLSILNILLPTVFALVAMLAYFKRKIKKNHIHVIQKKNMNKNISLPFTTTRIVKKPILFTTKILLPHVIADWLLWRRRSQRLHALTSTLTTGMPWQCNR